MESTYNQQDESSLPDLLRSNNPGKILNKIQTH